MEITSRNMVMKMLTIIEVNNGLYGIITSMDEKGELR